MDTEKAGAQLEAEEEGDKKTTDASIPHPCVKNAGYPLFLEEGWGHLRCQQNLTNARNFVAPWQSTLPAGTAAKLHR